MDYSFRYIRAVEKLFETETIPLTPSEIREKLKISRQKNDTLLEKTLLFMESNNRILYGKDKNKEPTFYGIKKV